MEYEGEEDDEEDDDGVVHEKVSGVSADPEVGIAEAQGKGEGLGVDHIAPWPAG